MTATPNGSGKRPAHDAASQARLTRRAWREMNGDDHSPATGEVFGLIAAEYGESGPNDLDGVPAPALLAPQPEPNASGLVPMISADMAAAEAQRQALVEAEREAQAAAGRAEVQASDAASTAPTTEPSPALAAAPPSRRALRRSENSGRPGRGKALAWAGRAAILTGLVAGTIHVGTTDAPAVPVVLAGPQDGGEILDTIAVFDIKHEQNAELDCRVNAGPWQRCATPVTVEDLSAGVHQLQVRATDGDRRSEVATRTWLVGKPEQPVAFVKGPASGAMIFDDATFSISSRGGADTECAIDDEPFAPCADSFTVSNLRPGPHIVKVRPAGSTDDSLGDRRMVIVADVPAMPDAAPAPDSSPLPEPIATPSLPLTPDGEDGLQGTPVPVDDTVTIPAEIPTDGVISTPTMPAPSNGSPEPIVTPPPTIKPRPTTPVQTAPAPDGAGSYGVPADYPLRVHNGDLTITEAGAHIDGLDVRGFIRVRAENVKITNTVVRGGDAPHSIALIQSEYPGVTIENVTLDPTTPSPNIDGIKGYGFTVRGAHIRNVVDGVLIHGDNSRIYDSWIHDHKHYRNDPNQGGKASHDDSVQITVGSNIVISGNRLEDSHNAAIQLAQDAGRITNTKITGNYMANGGCTVNIAEKGKGAYRGLTISGNTFGASRVANCPIIAPESTRSTMTVSNNEFTSGQDARVKRGD